MTQILQPIGNCVSGSITNTVNIGTLLVLKYGIIEIENMTKSGEHFALSHSQNSKGSTFLSQQR